MLRFGMGAAKDVSSFFSEEPNHRRKLASALTTCAASPRTRTSWRLGWLSKPMIFLVTSRRFPSFDASKEMANSFSRYLASCRGDSKTSAWTEPIDQRRRAFS